jgi:hypothetical protein
VTELSADEARWIAIEAQQLVAPRSQIRAVVERLGVLQLDSVNVLVRSHYLPLWSRLGAYDRAALDRLAQRAPRALFEYWGHEASWLPVALHPLMRWRMARAAEHAWRHVRAIRNRRAFLKQVIAAVTERGPLSAGELELGKPARGGWWEWSDAKRAIEWLFYTGHVTTAGRRGFERLYDLTERVLPAKILALPTPSEADAQRALIERAARAMGVATEADLRDYYRIRPAPARAAIATLVEAGVLAAVRVDGWKGAAYLHREAPAPRRAAGVAALLSPFDSLIWARDRTERLFGMRYRLEIYTPAAKRVHGYYVLPFLLGDRLVARVDLKSDRAGDALLVHAAHAESHTPARAIAPALATQLAGLASWLGLARVAVTPAGDLGAALAVSGA